MTPKIKLYAKVFALLLALGIEKVSAQAVTNYEIDGKLVGIDSVTTVYIRYKQGMKAITDSAKVVNKKYVLKGYVQTGQEAAISCFNLNEIGHLKQIPRGGLFRFFLSPEKSSITHTSLFNQLSITGAPDHDTYELLMTKANSHKGDAAYKQQVLGDFIKSNPNSPVAFAALKEMAGGGHKVDGLLLKPYFDRLPESVQTSDEGIELGDHITTAVAFATTGAIGSKAPDFTLLDTSGRQVKLSDIKGKYVLVDFWASWCTPCRQDNPNLVAAYQEYHDKGFSVISVSLDGMGAKKSWLNAIAHDHLGAWTHVADLDHPTNAAVKLFGVEAIPQNFLIGPDGRIIARSLRGDDLKKKLKELL